MKKISLNREDWDIKYSPKMPDKPLDGNPGIMFKFPGMNGRMNYLIRVRKDELGANFNSVLHVKGRIIASANAVFDYKTEPENVCVSPSSFRPVLIRNMFGEHNRWWPMEGHVLDNGPFDLRIPLHPSKWVSVYGKHGDIDQSATNKFKECLREPINIGLTFGGGCFYGHGVRMSSGTARFELTSMFVSI